MKIILDIEADSLTPTRIWCCIVKDIDTNAVVVLLTPEDAQRWFSSNTIDLYIAHNGINYDFLHLEKLWNIKIPREKCRDTLVLSRLLDQGMEGGHSLEAWGTRLKFPKQDFNDFSKLSYTMIEYCINDVHLNHELWKYLLSKFVADPYWKPAINVEHEMAFICREMHLNGFRFNITEAKTIYAEVQALVDELDKQLNEAFPPIRLLSKQTPARYKKDGTLNHHGQRYLTMPDVEFIDDVFYFYEWQSFNVGSPKQVIDRIKDYWKPTDKTKGHILAIKEKSDKLDYFSTYGWSINEVNLATLSDDAPPAAHLLVKRIMLGSRLRTLTSWMEAYQPDEHIHGHFNSLGTWTHRLSHSDPNLGNVAAEKTIKYKTKELRDLAIHYGGRMRKLFIADEDAWLVGTDMEGAHLRLFAHFINDDRLIQALISGDKKLGTDAHTLNMRALGPICPDRDLAKTFIFTYLNGGAAPKVSEIFRCSMAEARSALVQFQESYPGLDSLKRNQVPVDAARGWFRGLDGRKVPCTSEHLMIAGYLQNGEKVVMAHANVLWRKELDKLGIRYRQVNLVHDEFQTNIIGTEAEARKAGEVQSEAIKQTGINLGIVCPLAGEYKIGKDWLETH